ncbi:MAG: glycoside hydrolase N-terminal domain-containing protein [Clostridia bacterium]|nr:glycoside hydrolase N-terminal domain-containing protein [Clostridia bacterium]
MLKREYDIVYDKSILQWDKALPLGNGKIGCLVYGGGPLRFALDSVDLWDKRPNPVTKENGFNYKNLVSLVKSNDEKSWKEHNRLFDNIYAQTPYPTKLTAGRLELDFGFKTDSVLSKISLKTAVATVKFGDISIEIFLSAKRFIGVAKIYGDFNLSIVAPEYVNKAESEKGLNYPQGEFLGDGQFLSYIQPTKTDFVYGIVALKKQFNDHCELYFTVENNAVDGSFIENVKRRLQSLCNLGYEKLKEEHLAWWKNYWKKSSIDICDKQIEKVYYRSYYLFASCSREGFYPMPLQGVWTADDDNLPPWKGDYHHDTNTQLSYQSYLKANRLKEGKVFIDYLWQQKDNFKKFAKDFYGVDGILLPGVSTIDGKPLGGWPQYALSPTMTIWSAQSFDEYYLYTGDKKFLSTQAYPFFKGVGQAFLELLEEKNGKLYLPLSTSPEIFDSTKESYLIPNTNFDLALLKYLFKTLVSYSQILDKDGSVWQNAYDKLDDFAIIDGVLALDKQKKLPQTHRHFSHVQAMYPLHLINYDNDINKKLYKKTIEQIEYLGTGMWAGFSFAMSAQLYAMEYEGNSAYERLKQFANGFVEENGFHLNGDFKNFGYTTLKYRPFTLESLFGFCDALQETLLQEHLGYLHLFSAIPVGWKDNVVKFNNFRSYNGVIVSAKYKNGKTQTLTLKRKGTALVNVLNNFGKEQLTLSDGRKIYAKRGEIFSVKFEDKILIN